MDASAAGSAWGGLASWADKARKSASDLSQVAYETVQGDPEKGEAGSPQWTNWAKGAADRAKASLNQAAEQAKAADWGDKAKSWQSGMASTLGNLSESAAKAGSGFSDQALAASQSASKMAGSAKDNLHKSASSISSSVSGMGALATSPKKLMQFAAIFMLGMMLISLSLSFLPLLPIKPQKFALLFALGSMTTLGSVAFLRGPVPFAKFMAQRDKLPFSGLYVVGLVGTLWATLIARSYIYTTVFALMQAVGLLYFLASFIPGGRMVLNFFGKYTTKATKAVVFRG